MVQLARIKVNWTGFIGAPGYSNLYWRDPGSGDMSQSVVNSAVTAVDTWLNAFQSSIPTAVNYVIDPAVDVIDDTTGNLVNLFTASPAAARLGTGAGAYSAASGAVVNWKTTGIRNGRKIRGRTFMVPYAGTALDVTGSLDNTKLTAVRTATQNMISAFGTSALVVWCRPTGPDESDGVAATVTGFTIPDMAAILRSRRD
ncbi:MAG TPA: hypothetical protein VGW40_16780 [Allosphingosinicella sp.]|nr:hypothetical protein [Allosphingosinicella sp.]